MRLSDDAGLTGIYGEYGGLGIDDEGTLHVAWGDGRGHVGAPGAHGGTWYARWDGRVEAAPGAAGSPRTGEAGAAGP